MTKGFKVALAVVVPIPVAFVAFALWVDSHPSTDTNRPAHVSLSDSTPTPPTTAPPATLSPQAKQCQQDAIEYLQDNQAFLNARAGRPFTWRGTNFAPSQPEILIGIARALDGDRAKLRLDCGTGTD